MKRVLTTVLIAITTASVAQAVTCTWNGSDGNWSDANWTNGVPGAGDNAIINSGNVSLTNATPYLGTFTMNGGTLTFDGWDTKLTATNINMTAGTITHAVNSDDAAPWIPTARVYLEGSNITIVAGASIDTAGLGYRGGTSNGQDGRGPGGHTGYGGGSYGGIGGLASSGAYGAIMVPTNPGSGGGRWDRVTGDGGGDVYIDMLGTVTVHGSISADGEACFASGRAGAGSGGSVYISCNVFQGTNGIVTTEGGKGGTTSSGAGGGGRIAVHYNTVAQAAAPAVEVIFSAGTKNSATDGWPGTLYFSDNAFLDEVVIHGGMWEVTNFPSWSVDSLVISNESFGIDTPGFVLTVTNNLLVTGAESRFIISNILVDVGGDVTVSEGDWHQWHGTNLTASLSVTGDLLFSNNGRGFFYTSETNAASTNYGGVATIGGELRVSSGSIVYPTSHKTLGGAYRFEAGNLLVESGASFNADYRGYRAGIYPSDRPGRGDGAGYNRCGGGYGGKGGIRDSSVAGSFSYGSATNPVCPGSGGGTWDGTAGHGGGAILLYVTGQATVNGILTANGGHGSGNAGAGSGGSILVQCNTFVSTNGLLSANGGTGGDGNQDPRHGGGGGGRIAVKYNTVAQVGMPFPTAFYTTSTGRRAYSDGRPENVGEVGTVYFPDTQLFPLTTGVIPHGGQLVIPGFTSWAPDTLLITNNWFKFPDGFELTVTNDIQIMGGPTANNPNTPTTLEMDGAKVTCGGNLVANNAWLQLTGVDDGRGLDVTGDVLFDSSAGALSANIRLLAGSTNDLFACGGSFVLTNTAQFSVYSELTNAAGPDNGALVDITGDFFLASNSWVYPYSQQTNGGSPLFRVGSLTVPYGNSGFNADSRGYPDTVELLGGSSGFGKPGLGPGRGKANTGGAGHGGRGGLYDAMYGLTYGYSNAPIHPGSSGGTWDRYAGNGGGVIRIESVGKCLLRGRLWARGGNASTAGSGDGGGSGGSIFLRCSEFIAAPSASIRVDGGDGAKSSTGSGGGGRIAVWYGAISATNEQLIMEDRLDEVPRLVITNNHLIADVRADGSTVTNVGENGTIVFITIIPPYPLVETWNVGSMTATSAVFNGDLVSTGAAATTAWLYWGETDEGTNNSWTYTNEFVAPQPEGLLSTNAMGLTANKQYYYRFAAQNTNGFTWATSSISFNTGELWIEASDPAADEDGLDPGEFKILRHTWATDPPLTVTYAITGTASNGEDYALLTGSINMPSGVSNVTITVTPEADANESEGPETILLSLTGNSYVIKPMNIATVTIADAIVDITNTWIGGTGRWSTLVDWSSGHVPVHRQNVVITNGSVLIESSSAMLRSLVISNATLVCSNWATKVTATNIFVLNNGKIALPEPFNSYTNTDIWYYMSTNRIWLSCSNLFVASGGHIDADGSGFMSRRNGHVSGGHGPGGGDGWTGGAGHGGYGAGSVAGKPYGSIAAPVLPGSGAGVWDRYGYGDGGGVIRIEATDRVTVSGTISANGEEAHFQGHSGGGAGGSIWITCLRLAGTNGNVQVDGGSDYWRSTAAGGAGGRISVIYDPTAQSNEPLPDVIFSASVVDGQYDGDPGSLYFPDAQFLPSSVMTHAGIWYASNFVAWNPPSLLVSNITFGFMESGFDLDVTGDVMLLGTASRLILSNGVTDIGGDLTCSDGELRLRCGVTSAPVLKVTGNATITNGATWNLYAASTNGAQDYGGLVTIDGCLSVSETCWVRPYSDPTNGGSMLLRVGSLTVATNAGFNANSRGFAAGTTSHKLGWGPGGGTGGSGGGGGYGGRGGTAATGGSSYGSTNAPIHAGSGGGKWDRTPGAGGGLIRIEAARSVVLAGSMLANGGDAVDNGGSAGGGSGGGIFVICSEFLGEPTAVLSATGGDAGISSYTEKGDGGGGRIAIWQGEIGLEEKSRLMAELSVRNMIISTNDEDYLGSVSVIGGQYHANAVDGTIVFLTVPKPAGTVFILR